MERRLQEGKTVPSEAGTVTNIKHQSELIFKDVKSLREGRMKHHKLNKLKDLMEDVALRMLKGEKSMHPTLNSWISTELEFLK